MSAPRGQATVELALGSLVFVTLLLFGLFFAELPVVALKLKEATRFAAFEAAQGRHHQLSLANVNAGSASLGDDPLRRAEVEARRRYRDFDGERTTSSGTLSLTVTSATGFQLDCERDPALDFGVQGATGAASRHLQRLYGAGGGARCQASALVSPLRIGEFAERGTEGFFGAAQWASRYQKLRVCGAGSARDNDCGGRGLAVLGGDWAFDGPSGSSLNGDVKFFTTSSRWRSLNDVDNPALAAAALDLYRLGPGKDRTAGSALLRRAAMGGAPNPRLEFDETEFFMSFEGLQGARLPVRRLLGGSGNLHYPTVGVDLPELHAPGGSDSLLSWDERSGRLGGLPRCFLGLAGCAP
ncbi:MAG: hypothetical protein K1X89_20300 [Myxococcaceae bacterium]|nr:hypothetical protein [Myxococcaceae bacterium]